MTYAFRCPQTQLVEFADAGGLHTCPYCHQQHEAQQVGAPPPEPGPPQISTFRPKYSQLHKTWITSARQEDRLDEAKGIATISKREAREMNPGLDGAPTIASYPGQVRHKRVKRIKDISTGVLSVGKEP